LIRDHLDEEERHVVHASLYRPVLFAGVEFGVLVTEATTVLALLFVIGVHAGTVVLAVMYAVGVHALAVWVTAGDAQITAVYLRSLFVRDYYPAHGRPHVPSRPIRDALPKVR
jgi:type IV secretory pathway TrbD component